MKKWQHIVNEYSRMSLASLMHDSASLDQPDQVQASDEMIILGNDYVIANFVLHEIWEPPKLGISQKNQSPRTFRRHFLIATRELGIMSFDEKAEYRQRGDRSYRGCRRCKYYSLLFMISLLADGESDRRARHACTLGLFTLNVVLIRRATQMPFLREGRG